MRAEVMRQEKLWTGQGVLGQAEKERALMEGDFFFHFVCLLKKPSEDLALRAAIWSLI